jgi:hypothetical protein
METQEIISRLRQGTREWNLWRKSVERSAVNKVKSIPASIPLIDFIGELKELVEVNLEGKDINLRGIKLNGARLGAYRALMRLLEERGLRADYSEFRTDRNSRASASRMEGSSATANTIGPSGFTSYFPSSIGSVKQKVPLPSWDFLRLNCAKWQFLLHQSAIPR